MLLLLLRNLSVNRFLRLRLLLLLLLLLIAIISIGRLEEAEFRSSTISIVLCLSRDDVRILLLLLLFICGLSAKKEKKIFSFS